MLAGGGVVPGPLTLDYGRLKFVSCAEYSWLIEDHEGYE